MTSLQVAPDCLVIGAGIAGLVAATTLQAAGWHVHVVDKGRGLGGRMATRRLGEGVVDYGAQFFTAHQPPFATWTDTWAQAKLCRAWFHKPGPCGDVPAWVGSRGMTTIPKHLADGLTVTTQQQIIQLSVHEGHWQAHASSGQRFQAKRLLITAPAPRILALWENSNLPTPAHPAWEQLHRITYAPCTALLVRLDGPNPLPEPGTLAFEDNPVVSWVANNHQKGISPEARTLTVHSTSQFGAAAWDHPDEILAQRMLDAIASHLTQPVAEWQIHRWRYSQVTQAFDAPYLLTDVAGLPLALAGDGFGGPRVELAALSGYQAAQALLHT